MFVSGLLCRILRKKSMLPSAELLERYRYLLPFTIIYTERINCLLKTPCKRLEFNSSRAQNRIKKQKAKK